MTTNFQTIANILTQERIPYEADEKAASLYISINTKNLGHRWLAVQVIAQGETILVHCPHLFSVKDKVYKGMLMQALLILQKSIPLIRFYLSTTAEGDEVVSAYIELPLLDNPLTKKNLFYALEIFINQLEKAMPRLQHILATGEEPAQKSSIEQLLDEMSPDSIEQLAQLLQERKAS